MLDHAYDLGHLPLSGEILRSSTKYRRSSTEDSKAPSNRAQDVELTMPDGASDLRWEGES